MELVGQILPEQTLRFNSALKYASDPRARKGVSKFGPYDSSLFQLNPIRCGVIFDASLNRHKDILVNGLQRGDDAFVGFSRLFRVDLKFEPSSLRSVVGGASAFRRAASEIANTSIDLVYVVASSRDKDTYKAVKATLLANGIPCQFVTAEKLASDTQRPWVLESVALASYAKVGGTPWVVADVSQKRQLVMGVSRAQDRDKRYVFGFVTIFNQDGDYLLLQTDTPVVRPEEYVAGLERLVSESIREFDRQVGPPESIVLHFHKRPGDREIGAIVRALEGAGSKIPFALMHLNEFSGYRLFDTSHSGYVARTGLSVSLGRRHALLLLDGLDNGTRKRMGMSNVWDISLDRRSTMDPDSFPALVRQIHRFSRVNWRGFNAKSTPVTLNYSKLICDQVLEVGLDSWNALVASGKLRDKAWFL